MLGVQVLTVEFERPWEVVVAATVEFVLTSGGDDGEDKEEAVMLKSRGNAALG